MTFKDNTPKSIFVNIDNQWGYPDDAFDAVLDHLCSLLISTKMNPEEIHDDLGIAVDSVLELYDPRYHEDISDYAVLADIENRYFETLDNAKDLLNIVLGDHQELRSVYMLNVTDVEVVKISDQWGLIRIVLNPPGAALWNQPTTQGT